MKAWRELTGPAEDAKQALAAISGYPATEIHGYVYLLVKADGQPLCHGSNGLHKADMITMLRQAIEISEQLGEYEE